MCLGRFAKWLQIMEVTGERHGLKADSGFLLGTTSATFADTTVFALWATMERSLPELSRIMRQNAPKVMALCDRIGTNTRVAELLHQQPTAPYCGGQIEKSLRTVLANMASH